MERGEDRSGVVGRWRAMPFLWRMRVRALGYVALGELAYLYVIFGSHKQSSLSRWIVGFYLQVVYVLIVLAAIGWGHLRKRWSRTHHSELPPRTGVRLDELEAWVRRTRQEHDNDRR
jgi:hypothetical protein